MRIPNRLTDELLRRLLWDLHECAEGSSPEERKTEWYAWLVRTTKQVENELTLRHCGDKVDAAITKERNTPRLHRKA